MSEQSPLEALAKCPYPWRCLEASGCFQTLPLACASMALGRDRENVPMTPRPAKGIFEEVAKLGEREE